MTSHLQFLFLFVAVFEITPGVLAREREQEVPLRSDAKSQDALTSTERWPVADGCETDRAQQLTEGNPRCRGSGIV